MKKDKIAIIASKDEIVNSIISKEKFSNVKIIIDDGNLNPDEITSEAVFVVEGNQNSDNVTLIKKWVGHNHMRYIKNKKTPECTADSLIKEIIFFAESEYEIEKKFLIKYPDLHFLNNLYNCKEVEIEQVYLKSKDGESRRIRRRSVGGKTQCYHTVKKQITSTVREEIETLISVNEYEKLKKEIAPKCEIITKKRYCLMENGCYFEIDIFPFMKNTAVLEIELKNENDKFTLPEFIEKLDDVTEKPEFTNYNMSKNLKTNPDFYNTL